MSSTLCDTCDKDSRYMAARAENDRLRTERDMYIAAVEGMVHPDVCDQLQAENAELRELLRDYDKVLADAVYVWGTVADFLGYGRKYDALYDRARELGVEV